MDYYKIIKDAIKYDLDKVKKIDDMVDVYQFCDKFLFRFPPSYKNRVTIYLYDNIYDVYNDFDKATLKVYENYEWLVLGRWITVLNKCATETQELIDEKLAELEQEEAERKKEEQRLLEEQIRRFRILFGELIEEFVDADHIITADKVLHEDTMFDTGTELGAFLHELFESERIFRFPDYEDEDWGLGGNE